MRVCGTSTVMSYELREKLDEFFFDKRSAGSSLCVYPNGLTIKTREYAMLEGFGPDHNLGVFNSSVWTIERAFAERFFLCKDGDTYRPPFVVGPRAFRNGFLTEFKNSVIEHMPNLPIMTSQQVVDTYSGPKWHVYFNALLSLEMDELTQRDSRLATFVKREKQDVAKAPRLINPRSPRYNLRLGKYLKHAEHHFYRAINKVFGKRTHATVIKGFNADQSANILRQKWEVFEDPVAVGLDASKFDMHVSVAALRYEHSYYTSLFPRSNELRQLLRWQLTNGGVATAIDGQVKFTINGTRSSGDLNTSLGNCILMCSMVWAYCKQLSLDIELANNGDDCVVFMERKDVALFNKGLPGWFKIRGFAMCVEPAVEHFERVEFCQTRPVLLSTGWRMVRNVSACFRKDLMCLMSVPTDEVYKKWLAAVGTCGGTLCQGVPVLEEFYAMFRRNGTSCSPGFLREVYKNRSQLQLCRGVARAEICPQARVSFYYAFNILPDEQVCIEHYLRSVVFDELGGVTISRKQVLINPGINIITESE